LVGRKQKVKTCLNQKEEGGEERVEREEREERERGERRREKMQR